VKTPAAILDKLNAEMLKIVKQPDMKERMSTFAFTPVNDSREGCAAYLKSEIARWGKAIRDSGAKAD
jgi:tripartite-type tricarboxylate transporter receptor subunit TctC